jgi:hypothetical protein
MPSGPPELSWTENPLFKSFSKTTVLPVCVVLIQIEHVITDGRKLVLSDLEIRPELKLAPPSIFPATAVTPEMIEPLLACEVESVAARVEPSA